MPPAPAMSAAHQEVFFKFEFTHDFTLRQTQQMELLSKSCRRRTLLLRFSRSANPPFSRTSRAYLYHRAWQSPPNQLNRKVQYSSKSKSFLKNLPFVRARSFTTPAPVEIRSMPEISLNSPGDRPGSPSKAPNKVKTPKNNVCQKHRLISAPKRAK